MAGTWLVERETGSAAAFHARGMAEPATRRMSVLDVVRPTLVIGSTQPRGHVDAGALAAGGVELVRRRSGGGAVLLVPGQALWIDVVVPRGDTLWDDDVGGATHWLGATWVGALAELGVPASSHTGGVVASLWSSRVCFAGTGPGEVSVGGRKAVGISQRRTRAGARFQCLALARWEPAAIVALLALSSPARRQAVDQLSEVATGIDRPFAEIIDSIVCHLPRS